MKRKLTRTKAYLITEVAFMCMGFFGLFNLMALIVYLGSPGLADALVRIALFFSGMIFPLMYLASILIRRERLVLQDAIFMLFAGWFVIERAISAEFKN